MFSKLIKRWMDMKLSLKLTLIFAILITLVFSIAWKAQQNSFDVYDQELYERSLQELDFFAQRIDYVLDTIEEFSYNIIMNANLQESLSSIRTLTSAEYEYQMYLFRNQLFQEMGTCPAVVNVFFTDRKQTEFVLGTYSGTIGNEMKERLYAMFDENRGGYASIAPSDEYPYLLSGRNILETADFTLNRLGSIIITSDIAGEIQEQSSALEAEHAMLYVFSDEGDIYRDDTDLFSNLPVPEENVGYQILRYESERYFVCYLHSSQMGWTFVNAFPYSDIYGQTAQIRSVLFFIFLGILLFSLFMMRQLATVITKPLKKLTSTMQIAQTGDFAGAKTTLVPPFSKDEVGMLTQDFRLMIKKIDALIHENYEKQLLLKDTKYRMLQAQINPHFLYNTLNTINWMVKAKRNDDAILMIVELGKLLRASFTDEPYLSAAQEVDISKSYITIQRFRYEERAKFTIETSGELAKYRVPSLMLQPLIENAVTHGVDNSATPCEVRVQVREEEDHLRIEVSDDGAGMSAQQLEKVRAADYAYQGNGVGIRNIRERLSMTYENSEFIIDSITGKGTRIVIRIPKVGMASDV